MRKPSIATARDESAFGRRFINQAVKAIAVSSATAIMFTGLMFGLNFTISAVGPAHYRTVILEAVADGTLGQDYRWLLGPDRTMPAFGGNDCLIASMLASPIESNLKSAISPRMPGTPEFTAPEGFPRAPFCAALAALALGKPALDFSYYHRYLHGDRTFAGLLLADFPLGVATQSMRIGCFTLLGIIALVALKRRRRPGQQFRSDAIILITATLAAFYGLPQFGQSFSFAPTDLTLFAFILFTTTSALDRLQPVTFAISLAVLGSAVAAFEFLTGGIPVGATIVALLIAIDRPPDTRGYIIKVVFAGLIFGTAVFVCFAIKLVALWVVWGPSAVANFFAMLEYRIGGGVSSSLPAAMGAWLRARDISPELFDTSLPARVILEWIMLTYSSFSIGWGSHVLGAVIVLLPMPYLAYRAARARMKGVESYLFLASLLPVLWYLTFTNHTIQHSSYMVRPLSVNLALGLIVFLLARPTNNVRTREGSGTPRHGTDTD